MTTTKIDVNGKIAGEYDDVTKTYTTHRQPEHYMIKFQGHGISQSIIDRLINLGCETIIILYHGKTGERRYKCSIDKFAKSIKTHNFNGTDLQKFVSTKDMENLDNSQEKTIPFSEDLHKSYFNKKEMTIKPSQWPGQLKLGEEVW